MEIDKGIVEFLGKIGFHVECVWLHDKLVNIVCDDVRCRSRIFGMNWMKVKKMLRGDGIELVCEVYRGKWLFKKVEGFCEAEDEAELELSMETW